MLTKSDKQYLQATFVTKDEFKVGLAETTKYIIKEITDFLHEKIILVLEQHERRLDRLEKTVGGFPPITAD
jgi:hypothetical protein